jgi:hypothetical protein
MRTTRPLRIAARPPLTLLASRRTAAPYTHGLNDDYLLQGCTSIFLKRQGGDWYSHLLTTKSRQTNECRALHAHLDMPLSIADLARSARPESSRFPMTTDAPRFNSATPVRGRPSSRSDGLIAFRRLVARVKKKMIERKPPFPKTHSPKNSRNIPSQVNTNTYLSLTTSILTRTVRRKCLIQA